GDPLLGAGGGELPRQVRHSVQAPGYLCGAQPVIRPEPAPSPEVSIRRAWPGFPAWPASSPPRLSAGPCAPLQRGAGSNRVRTRDTYGPPFCSAARSMLRPPRMKEKMLAARAFLAGRGGGGVRGADGGASGDQCAERPAGRLKQPGERRFRARSSFHGRVEAEFPALRALQMSEIAVAHFLRQRPVGILPEWGSQRVTHGVFLSGCEAPIRRAWRTKTARSRRRGPDARVPASGPCG